MGSANNQSVHIEDDRAELLALEAAIAEADRGGPSIPHVVVRKRLLEMVVEADKRISALAREAPGNT
jgi:hypothetical protein